MEKNYRNRSRRKIFVAFGLLASSVVAFSATTISPVQAETAPISVTAPSVKKRYVSNRTEWLPKFVVKNRSTFNLVVGVSLSGAPNGTKFSIGQTKGLTLRYGYSGWTHRSSIAFSGKTADINRALESMKLHAAKPGKVTLKVSATADDTQLAYEPISSRYYGFVPARGITWTDAFAAASKLSFRGTSAYLAAVTTADENDFISYNIENAANAWIGATDKDAEGDFKWATGEVAGQTFWKAACSAGTGADSCTGANNVLTGGWANTYRATVSDNPVVNTYSSWDQTVENTNPALNYHEPNNWGGDEDYVVTNWKGSVGLWNDLPNSAGNNPGVSGYIVEYASEPGKPFTGVVEATASYRVFAETSEYAPRNVSINRSDVSGMGVVGVSWSQPSYRNATQLAKRKVRVKQYFVTSSVRPGERFCETTQVNKRQYSCGIDGFVAGEELYFTVHAVYTRPPKGGGLFRRGQRTFGTADEETPLTKVAPLVLSVQKDRQVRDGATVRVSSSDLKPGSAFTVTANGSTVVLRGTVGSDGKIPASTSFRFPASALAAAYNPQLWWMDRQLATAIYTLSATKADGTSYQEHVHMMFRGSFYMWAAVFGSAVPLGSLINVVPHTAVP